METPTASRRAAALRVLARLPFKTTAATMLAVLLRRARSPLFEAALAALGRELRAQARFVR